MQPTLLEKRIRRFDWPLFVPAIVLTLIGILTMSTFGVGASLAPRQLIFLALSIILYGVISSLDMRFIRRSVVVITMYAIGFVLLTAVLVIEHPVMGAKAWFTLGPISFQPADFAMLALIAVLAKYLSRRHVEIGNIRHIIVSGLYALGFIGLIVVEPDMGNAIIFSILWLGMMLVSGISKKHLLILGAIGLVLATALWFGGLKPYQRTRIISFVNPASDIQGAGYNAYQAKIAVGSGQWFGKGIGYGTQSKLRFLPEYQTDFIFAAFAEEWGFVGVILLFALYALVFIRLITLAQGAATNFDTFFTLGVVLFLASHLAIHVGISLGLLPVTGTTVPFMSSGGSHLVLEFILLGIVTSLARHGRHVRRGAELTDEYVGS